MSRPKQLKPGDIIWVKYNGKYFFARILMDFKDMSKRPDVAGTPFQSFITSGSYYLELFEGIYSEPMLNQKSILFNGFVYRNYFHARDFTGEDWQWYKHIPINPEQLDFPEYVTADHSKNLIFFKGELRFETKIPAEYYEKYSSYCDCYFDFEGVIILGLVEQNRGDLIKPEDLGEDISIDRILKKEKRDLRFNPELRTEIYKSLKLNPNITYFELALKFGKDIRRFFN